MFAMEFFHRNVEVVSVISVGWSVLYVVFVGALNEFVASTHKGVRVTVAHENESVVFYMPEYVGVELFDWDFHVSL